MKAALMAAFIILVALTGCELEPSTEVVEEGPSVGRIRYLRQKYSRLGRPECLACVCDLARSNGVRLRVTVKARTAHLPYPTTLDVFRTPRRLQGTGLLARLAILSSACRPVEDSLQVRSLIFS